MANTKAVRFNAPKFMQAEGLAVHINDYCVPTAAASGDTFDFYIPAGLEITNVAVQSAAFDTNGTPTLAFKLGYLAVDSTSSLTAVDNYFAAAGATIMRGGGRLVCAFEPITFNEDVIVRLTLTASAATFAAAGKLWAIVSGNANGPK